MKEHALVVHAMRLFLVGCFVCFGFNHGKGQSIDSLTQILGSDSTSEATKIELHNKLSIAFRSTNYEEAIDHALQGMELAKRQGNRKWEGIAHSNLGGVYLANQKFIEAKKEFNEALDIFKNIAYVEGISDAYGNLGALFNETGALEKAEEFIIHANHLRDSLGLGAKLAIGYNNLSNVYIDAGDFEQAKKMLYQSIKIRRKLNDQAGIAQCYSNLIGFFGRQRQLDSALFYAQKALPIYKKIGNLQGLGKVNYNCGHIFSIKGDFEQSYTHYANARDIFEELGNEDFLNQCEISMGMLLHQYGEYDRALQRVKSAINYFEKSGSKGILGTAYTNYANLLYDYYKEQGRENESAVLDTLYNIHNKTLDIFTAIGDKLGIARSLANVGTIQWKQKKYAEAISSLEQGIAGYKEIGAEKNAANALVSLGKCYIQLSDFSKAILHLENAKKIQEENGLFGESLYADLADAYSSDGQYQKSNVYLRKKMEVMDSTFTKEKMEAITEIEAKYQTEKKETEIQLLAAKVQRQSITLISASIGLALLALITYLFYRRGVERQRANQLLTEKSNKIELLHRELSHRVKNNLAFVSSLMRMQARRLQSKEAQQAVKEGEARIEAMSLLHRKLYLKEDATVDLGDYLQELCENLQQTYPIPNVQRPLINVQTDKSMINGEDAVRVGLIVNELVTNSFKYAFADQPDPRINIQLSAKSDGTYQLFYRDNGSGLPAGFELDKNGSLGLKLVQTLTLQLKGQLKQYNEAGACFQINFEERKIAA